MKRGDVVVDLGSGSGVLAFFALEAGAARVYAIEQQHVADAAAMVARQNGYGDRIVFVHAYSLHADLPERANVLIAELLGMSAFDEQILGLILDARERYLAHDAVIVPQRIVLSCAPVELREEWERHIGWWNQRPYGIDFTPLRTFASNTRYSCEIAASAHLAKPADIIDVDLRTIASADARGNARFTATRDGTLHGFGAWFTATVGPGITVSNATPGSTHWEQAYLPLEEPFAIERGDEIELDLQTHDGRVWRWRGRAAGRPFDQTTWLSAPPCTQLRH